MDDLRIQRFDDFAAPGLESFWDNCLSASAAHEVFQTRAWLATWWQSFGRGELLLLGACRGQRPVALAPLFRDSGMIYFVGSGGSDYLDFVGDTRDEPTLRALLLAARRASPDFLGFLFYHIQESSPTLDTLVVAAAGLGLDLVDHGDLGAPRLELAAGDAERAARKQSLVRHTRSLERDGTLAIEHLESASDILPHLDDFFDQHERRWRETSSQSLFLEPGQREFYRNLTVAGAAGGWLRFTRVLWNGRAVAYHFGFCYERRFLWYKPCFDISLRERSPGEVLLRGLLLESASRAHTRFDFGLGEEGFKARFATATPRVFNRGLYPRKGDAPCASW